MKTILFALLLASAQPARAQCINAGGDATDDCGADQYFTGGAVWGPADQVGLQLLTLRYAAAFSYSIPVPLGAYFVTLSFVEPNKTAIGQRLFTVTVNGQQSDTIDVFALAGGAVTLPPAFGVPQSAPAAVTKLTYFAIASVGFLRLDFKATLGNAIVSRIEYSAAEGVRTITLNPVLDGATYRPQVRGEVPSFVSPGVFTLQQIPVAGSLAVYVNGLRQGPADYTLNGLTLTFQTALTADQIVLADYFFDMPIAPVPVAPQ